MGVHAPVRPQADRSALFLLQRKIDGKGGTKWKLYVLNEEGIGREEALSAF